ncbi:MAG: energy transducer TonB [Vulcanimicrobiaceae bacterium]
MSAGTHRRAAEIAGAIALGEASDSERVEYREHLSRCTACLQAFGGELEIGRAALLVAEARDGELWEPEIGALPAQRIERHGRLWRLAFVSLGGAMVLSLALHAAIAAGFARFYPGLAAPVVIDAGATRIVLERRSAPPPQAALPAPQRHLLVVHNVVRLSQAPAASGRAESVALQVARSGRQIARVTVHPDPAATSAVPNLPIWRRAEWTTVAQTTTTSLSETAPQARANSAESLQIVPAYPTREAAPIGGDTAITPQPPLIAYDEGAHGTAAFEVRIDKHGKPTKCIITESSGYEVLDVAVCKAAMKARYTPKMVGGHARAGIYRDAFTFRMSDGTAD